MLPETSGATILHADLDAFYASVEQRDAPHLRGRPVIVGGGVVLACSYEAKARGVRTAMGGRQAKLLCPDAIVVPPRFEAYTLASKAVFAIFDETTPLVEGISIDEAFLEVGGLRRIAGSPVDIATRLRQRVQAEVGLAITVGIARTKFLAKVASGVGKPDGLLVVPPDGELEFLHPLPVQKLWGVGTKTAEKLHSRGLYTVGEVATLDEEALIAMLGKGSGHQLHALAHNRDPRRVTGRKRRGSIGSQQALGTRLRSGAELDEILMGLIERITRRMRKAERVGRTVVLRMRFDDFSRATRSHSLPQATAHTGVVLETARALLADSRDLIRARGLTLLGFSVANLSDENPLQLALPFGPGDGPALDRTLDDLRDRFGTKSVQRAVLLGKNTGTTVPMLPD